MKSLKAAIGIGIRRVSRRKQAGVATILVILMVGIGLVAVSVGTMHTIRNTQDRHLVAHAQINAQAGAWAAVEAVRQLLGTLTADQLATLEKNNEWNISGVDGLTQTAKVTDIVTPVASETDYKITAIVSAVADAGQSSSTIEVVYSVKPAAPGGIKELTGVLDFYNDLQATGGITLNAPGQGLDFNVDGDFTVTNASVGGEGLRNINVTGNILLNSQVRAELLRGRNIHLDQSASAVTAEAWGIPKGEVGSTGEEGGKGKDITCCGNIKITAWPQGNVPKPIVVNAKANGNFVSSAGEVTNVQARKNVILTSGHGAVSIQALEDVEVGSVAKAMNVVAGRNLTIKGYIEQGADATLAALGRADCPGDRRGAVVKAKIAANLAPECKGTVDSSMLAPEISKVLKVELKRPLIDAHALKGSANYAIEILDDYRVMVTVKNVNGLADDKYYLGNFGKSQMHLCKAVTVDLTSQQKLSTCSTSDGSTSASALPFCINVNEDTSCITIDFDNKKFKVTANNTKATIPAGVIWFDGTLSLEGKSLFNTFIATKDIETSGNIYVYAVNYASDYLINDSSDAICKNQRGEATFSAYQNAYPTNFCSDNLEFEPQPIGNIGLIAGSYNPDNPEEFQGGNINLTADARIHGTVVAGNILKTSGSTTVYGYISAAGLQNDPTEVNQLVAKLDVDLTKKPKAYTPDKIPDTSGGGGGSLTPESRVLWTRYL